MIQGPSCSRRASSVGLTLELYLPTDTYLPHRQSSLVSCCGPQWATGRCPIAEPRHAPGFGSSRCCSSQQVALGQLTSTHGYAASSDALRRAATVPETLHVGAYLHAVADTCARTTSRLVYMRCHHAQKLIPRKAQASLTLVHGVGRRSASRTWRRRRQLAFRTRRRSFRRRTRACIRRFSSPR